MTKKEVISMKIEEYTTANVILKATTTYTRASYTKDIFKKNKDGSTEENWKFAITRQKDKDTNAVWMTLIRFDKDKNNIVQIDFDEISKKKLKKLINNLTKIYKQIKEDK